MVPISVDKPLSAQTDLETLELIVSSNRIRQRASEHRAKFGKRSVRDCESGAVPFECPRCLAVVPEHRRSEIQRDDWLIDHHNAVHAGGSSSAPLSDAYGDMASARARPVESSFTSFRAPAVGGYDYGTSF